MDRSSLPMMLYLNDGELDKTGYERLKQKAISKALRYYSPGGCVTIGPEAEQNKKSEHLNTGQRDTFINSSVPKTPSPLIKKKNVANSTHVQCLQFCEPVEQNEENLMRKRILASLENMCLQESQEKIEKMRREWIKRENESVSRMQGELEFENKAWTERRKKELNEIHIKLFHKPIAANSEFVQVEEEILQKTKENKDQYNAKIEEMNRLLQLLSDTKEQQREFREIDKCLQFNDSEFQDMISSEMEIMSKLTNEFSILTKRTEQRDVTAEDLNRSKILTANIKFLYNNIKSKLDKRKADIIEEDNRKIEKEREKKIKEEIAEKEKETEDAMNEEEVQAKEAESVPAPEGEIDAETYRIRSIMAHYKKYLKVYNDISNLLKDFVADDSLKKFRSECQKAVNVPVNAISAVSSAHLNDKLKKLSLLLSGQQVLINSRPFNPSQHPLGVTYCTYLLAEKIVKQGEDVVSVKPDAAFPIALVVLSLWGEFHQFGELLMAAFHRICPYLIPIYWIKEDGMSDKDYYKKLGFRVSEGEREDINMFLKREGGVVRLYFSIIVSNMKDRSKQHPLDLNEAWRWLAIFTSIEPSAEITATLLFDMLDVAGYAMKKTYEKQFFKLIHLICVQYLPKIEKVTPAEKGGPVSRLKSFLEQLIRTQTVKPPKGILPSNFW